MPANLMQTCTSLNRIEQGNGKDVLLWAVDTVAKYNECDARHAALVKAIE